VDVFQRILCATDFSDTAEAAWEMACELARVHGATLGLVHVFVELPAYAMAPEAPGPVAGQIWEEQRRWVRQSLDERVAGARTAGLTAKGLLVTGSAAPAIAETAAAEHADLLVIGTHGRTGINRLLIGSIAERVIRIAPCPVLTVKPRPAVEEVRAAA
jgi:nucleotide-binding universal stress UspA family protein